LRRIDLYKPLLGGVLALSVAMGIGRFAYTPMLPVMERELGLSVSSAGTLASINYIGYLIGALLAAWLPSKQDRQRLSTLAVCLLGSVLSTAAMAVSQNYWVWSILRGLGGVFSAVILVTCSSLIMDWLSRRKEGSKIGVFYAGVGLGIALTGVAVPWLDQLGDWRFGWYGLGLLSLLLAGCSIRLLRGIGSEQAAVSAASETVDTVALRSPFRLWGITVAYGLEGLGYIVMGTFVTVYFSQMSSASWLGSFSWVLVGLSALPSTWFWTSLAKKTSLSTATYLSFVAQAVGVILPTVIPGYVSALLGSVLFGGTFMGITTLALSIGRLASPEHSGKTIGNMTVVFSIGQIVGPIAAGVVTARTHSYSLSMLLSGVLLLAAVAVLRISAAR
jgi:predicted MFS family arabinose efflux permease